MQNDEYYDMYIKEWNKMLKQQPEVSEQDRKELHEMMQQGQKALSIGYVFPKNVRQELVHQCGLGFADLILQLFIGQRLGRLILG